MQNDLSIVRKLFCVSVAYLTVKWWPCGLSSTNDHAQKINMVAFDDLWPHNLCGPCRWTLPVSFWNRTAWPWGARTKGRTVRLKTMQISCPYMQCDSCTQALRLCWLPSRCDAMWCNGDVGGAYASSARTPNVAPRVRAPTALWKCISNTGTRSSSSRWCLILYSGLVYRLYVEINSFCFRFRSKLVGILNLNFETSILQRGRRKVCVNTLVTPFISCRTP